MASRFALNSAFDMLMMRSALNAVAPGDGEGSAVALDAGSFVRVSTTGVACAVCVNAASGRYARTARGSASRLPSHSPRAGRSSALSFE